MSSILLVKLEAPNYSSSGIVKAFQERYDNVYEFDWQKTRYNVDVEEMRRRLIGMAMMYQPDHIFLHIQNEDAIDVDTADCLSGIGFVVNYSFDCRDKKRTQWMYDLAPHIGLTLFSNREDVENCKALGIKKCSVLQSSFNSDLYIPVKEDCFEKGIVFIGNNYVRTNLDFPLAEERSLMVDFLSNTYGEDFTALGMGWGHGVLVNPKEEVSVYYGCEIAINHNNYNRKFYTSDRIWRIMATGTFCLTKYFEGIETMFKRGVHLDWWTSFDELKEKIDYYRSYSEEREKIAKAGCKLVLKKHNWTERVKTIKKSIEYNGKRNLATVPE